MRVAYCSGPACGRSTVTAAGLPVVGTFAGPAA